jgi:hypothetical protein
MRPPASWVEGRHPRQMKPLDLAPQLAYLAALRLQRPTCRESMSVSANLVLIISLLLSVLALRGEGTLVLGRSMS